MNHAIQGSRVCAGAIELEYEDHGSGERPFLLVHGFTGSRDDFREVLPALARRGRTLAVDQRGHGGSDNPGEAAGYDLPQLQADLLAFLDALGIERCDLLGHSLGGMMALRFALAHPERVASLVLMDTAPAPIETRARGYFEVAGKIATEQGMGALFALARKISENDPNRPAVVGRTIERMGVEAWWERIRAKLHAMDPVAFAALGAALTDHESVEARLGEIGCPTTIVVGEHDAPFRKPSDVLEAGIRGARQVVIPDAHHSPQLENTEAWLAAIEAHLDRARS